MTMISTIDGAPSTINYFAPRPRIPSPRLPVSIISVSTDGSTGSGSSSTSATGSTTTGTSSSTTTATDTAVAVAGSVLTAVESVAVSLWDSFGTWIVLALVICGVYHFTHHKRGRR